MTLTQGHGCDIEKQIFACLQDKVRTTQPITTKLGSYIPPVMLITWLDFGGILLEILFFCQIFLEDFGCVFSTSNTLLDISQEWLVRLMWNEKEVHSHSGVTLCFQSVSAASAFAAAKTFPSHIKTVWAKPLIFGTKNIWVWGNVLDDLSMTLIQGHSCGIH